LPAQRVAKVGMRCIEAVGLGLHVAGELVRRSAHAFPPLPAAASSARFTATPASLILYPFWLSGRALLTAAAPAAAAVFSSIALPVMASAASSETQGTGATAPKTMRADFTVRPF